MVNRLEHLFYEERSQELRLFSFLICIMGVCKKDGERFYYIFLTSFFFFFFLFVSPRISIDRTRGSGF